MPIPKKILEQAMAGDPQAQVKVGRHYAEGREVDYDLDEAFSWFERAAKRQHPEALLELGLAYEYGLGIDRDYDAAFRCYMQASRVFVGPLPFTLRGMVLTQNLCMERHRGQLTLAEAGFAHSQWAFVYGPEREHRWKENKDSRKWTRRAAELGYPPSLKSMAWQISAGQGRPEDEPKTLEWHLKAYEHDKLIAKSISMLYEPSDKTSWLSAHLDPKVRGIVPDKATSEEWNRRWQGHLREKRMLAVAGGSSSDARALGDQFFAGKEGAPQDYAEAMKWYQKAAELGDNWSCGQIAKMHLRGLGMPADLEKGLAWLDRQYAITYCEGTKVVDQGLIYHWVMRPIVEGYLDHLDEGALFAWLQARTMMYVPGCAALSGSYYGEGETAHLAAHVCKVFNPHVFVKEPLKQAEKKIVQARAARITRLMEKQKAAMIALAESGDAAAQFWQADQFKKYKGRAGRALKWLLLSAAQGFSPAQYQVGKCHIEGDGAPVSEPEARKWLEQASLRGHAWAQRDLINVLGGTCFWGDREEGVERKPDAQALFEGYAWCLACDYEASGAEAWRKYGPETVHAAYQRASEIRAEMARHAPKQGSAAG